MLFCVPPRPPMFGHPWLIGVPRSLVWVPSSLLPEWTHLPWVLSCSCHLCDAPSRNNVPGCTATYWASVLEWPRAIAAPWVPKLRSFSSDKLGSLILSSYSVDSSHFSLKSEIGEFSLDSAIFLVPHPAHQVFCHCHFVQPSSFIAWLLPSLWWNLTVFILFTFLSNLHTAFTIQAWPCHTSTGLPPPRVSLRLLGLT